MHLEGFNTSQVSWVPLAVQFLFRWRHFKRIHYRTMRWCDRPRQAENLYKSPLWHVRKAWICILLNGYSRSLHYNGSSGLVSCVVMVITNTGCQSHLNWAGQGHTCCYVNHFLYITNRKLDEFIICNLVEIYFITWKCPLQCPFHREVIIPLSPLSPLSTYIVQSGITMVVFSIYINVLNTYNEIFSRSVYSL